MSYIKFLVFLALLSGVVLSANAAPQQLLKIALESPDEKYAANVEWDAAGFMGRIQMQIFTRGEKPTSVVELPQIKPSPANLTWITDDVVACESFIAERGAAFVYMNVPRKRGYMIEIFSPDKDDDWLVSYTTNDSVSSDTIHTLSKGHSSLFPILMRNLPDEGMSYLSPDFIFLMSDAVDSFAKWRKEQKFVEMAFISALSENPKVGRLVLAEVDDVAEIVYFPQGTTTTREMLALTQRKPLPTEIQQVLNGVDPPNLSIEWVGDEGAFHILGTREDDSTSVTELLTGRFENVKDSVYGGPGIKELLKAASDSSSKESSSKKSDSKKSSSKKSDSKKSGSKSSSKKKSTSKSKSSKKPSRSD